jgi:hypothetical protein
MTTRSAGPTVRPAPKHSTIMAKVVKITLGVLIGFVAWFIVATLCNWVVRGAIPGYVEAEGTTKFTLTMLFARLVVAALSLMAAGVACALSVRSARLAALDRDVAVLPGPGRPVKSRLSGLSLQSCFQTRAHFEDVLANPDAAHCSPAIAPLHGS